MAAKKEVRKSKDDSEGKRVPGKSWYVTGKEGMARSKAEDAAAQARRQQRQDMPWRFRLDNNEEHVKVVMLDTPKFFLREHNLELGGKFGNFFTCR